MTENGLHTRFLLLCIPLLILMQACLLDAECVISANGRTTVTIKTSAPLLVHTLFVQSDTSFPQSLNRAVMEQRVIQNKGTLLGYSISENADTGSLEASMQFGNPEDAGRCAALFGISLNYAAAGRTFTCGFKDAGNAFSADLMNYADLLLKNFDFALRCTMPQAITRAQNGLISGNKVVFSKSFTRLADFFQSAVYTVQW